MLVERKVGPGIWMWFHPSAPNGRSVYMFRYCASKLTKRGHLLRIPGFVKSETEILGTEITLGQARKMIRLGSQLPLF